MICLRGNTSHTDIQDRAPVLAACVVLTQRAKMTCRSIEDNVIFGARWKVLTHRGKGSLHPHHEGED
jgi:hypothetical protein